MGARREKERIIGEVVIKVSEWRRMYTEQGITLEEAAKNIGISKKSLDDYFLQLRNGHLNGFNFNEHKNDKIGILRSFNKQKSKQKKAQPTIGDRSAKQDSLMIAE